VCLYTEVDVGGQHHNEADMEHSLSQQDCCAEGGNWLSQTQRASHSPEGVVAPGGV